MFDRLAEVANQYLSKGSKAYIEGKLKTREWEKDGAKRSTTEIVANKLEMLDSKQQKENFSLAMCWLKWNCLMRPGIWLKRLHE